MEELETRLAPAVDLTYPNAGVFAIGQVIHITGTASETGGIHRTAFELYKGGTAAENLVGTIFQGAAGSGVTSSYNWTTPATLGGQALAGSDYKIRMVAWSNAAPTVPIGDFSTSNLTFQISTARVNGIDVSHWQGTINWVQVSNAGVAFAFMKATEGTTYLDPKFAQNATNSRQAGVIPGAYHYARPDLGNAAVAEANWFVSQAGAALGAGCLPPVIDVEGAALGLPSATLSTWVDAYMDRVQVLTGIRPLLYASQGYLTYINQDPTQTELWVARYNGQDPQTGSPGNVSPWPTGGWKVWQYSSTGAVSGIAGNVDLDVFNGSYQAMYAWLAPLWDMVAPNVSAVHFDGAGWSSNVRAAAGDAAYGYIAQGGAGQLAPLPWNSINTIHIRFSEPVQVDAADLAIRGTNLSNYPIAGFSYDSASNTATWTLTAPINTDRVLIDLDGNSASGVVDLAGNKLAGGWAEGASSFPTTGPASVDFQYRFAVAVGDVNRDGLVRNADLNLIRNQLFVDVGQVGYSVFADVDGNGLTRNADLNVVRNQLFIDLPAGPGPFRAARRRSIAHVAAMSPNLPSPTSEKSRPIAIGELENRTPRRPRTVLTNPSIDECFDGIF